MKTWEAETSRDHGGFQSYWYSYWGFLTQEFEDAVLRFAACFWIVTVQSVKTRTRMGVNDGDTTLFLLQMLQGGNQAKVLDDIGVVAGVEGVSVTEHVQMVTPMHPVSLKNLAKPKLAGIKSRASQRISDPAAKGFQKLTPPKRFPEEEHRPWKRIQQTFF